MKSSSEGMSDELPVWRAAPEWTAIREESDLALRNINSGKVFDLTLPQPKLLPKPVALQEGIMRILMDVEGSSLTATLDDSATCRHFASLLPLTLTLTDYAATEKISDLPERLTTEGAPPGSDPSVGDIAYYAPWGNLAVFYRDFGYSQGLIKLGVIDAGIEALEGAGPLKVDIRLIEQQESEDEQREQQ
jgi:hypothetical protein